MTKLDEIKQHYGEELHICADRTHAPFARDTNADFQWLLAEVERLTVELTHRVGWEERCLDAEAALATLRAENARLRAVVALARLPDPVYGDDYGARCVYCGSIEDGHAESCPWVKLNGALSLLDRAKAS